MPVPFKDLQPEWQQYITRLVEEKADMTLMSYSLAVVCITLLVIFVWLAAVYVTNNKRANETKKMAEDRRVAYVYMLDMIVAGGRVDREGLEKVIIEHFSGDACLVDDMLLVSTNSGALTIADNKRRHIFTSVAEKRGLAFRLIIAPDGRILRFSEMMHGGFIIWRNGLPAEKLGFNSFAE